MSFMDDLDGASGGGGMAENETATQVAAEGAEYIQELGQSVKQCDLSIQELSSRVSVLLDDVTSAKSTKETLEAMRRSREMLELAKALSRKFTIWLSGTHGVGPHVKLQKEKLMSALDHIVHTFNELSDQVSAAVSRANVIRAGETDNCRGGGYEPSVVSTAASVGSRTDTFNMLALTQDLRKVQSNFEATQVIFDELGTLVRQQAPHLDSLENQSASTKQYSRDAANELHKEYARRAERTRRNWGCFLCLVFTVVFVLYVYVSPSASRSRHGMASPASFSPNFRGGAAELPQPPPVESSPIRPTNDTQVLR